MQELEGAGVVGRERGLGQRRTGKGTGRREAAGRRTERVKGERECNSEYT